MTPLIRKTLLAVTLLAILLAPAVGTQAQPAQDEVQALAVVTSGLNFQGRLANPDGTAVADGDYSVTFRLYSVAAGGSALATDTDTVHTERGVFNTSLDWGAALAEFDGQQLYIGIQLAGAPAEWTPRITVRPVPYALGLRPGAVIEGASAGHEPGEQVLNVINTATGAGRAAIVGVSGPVDPTFPGMVAGVIGEAAHGYGVSGASTDGTGAYGSSSSGNGVFGASNSGNGVYAMSTSGTAILAAGTGLIQSTAKTQIWVSGNAMVKYLSTDTTRWEMQLNGAARIYGGATAGGKPVYYPITLPSVLYGQPAKLSKLTVYYVCRDGAKGYIDGTYLIKQTDAIHDIHVVDDNTSHTSNTAVSYSLDLFRNNVLSADQGGLGLYIYLHFDDDINYVQIGGVRLELTYAP
jgi:hypothetical protein